MRARQPWEDLHFAPMLPGHAAISSGYISRILRAAIFTIPARLKIGLIGLVFPPPGATEAIGSQSRGGSRREGLFQDQSRRFIDSHENIHILDGSTGGAFAQIVESGGEEDAFVVPGNRNLHVVEA